MVHALLNVLLAYLVGSVPFGLLVGFMKGVDVRIAGSGNIGATNIGRLLGRPWGIAVFLLDLAKGLAGVGLGVFGAIALSDGWRDLGPTAGGLAAFLGHIFPVYLRFKGGKGVATGAGVALGLIPTFCLEALGIWLVVTLSTRMVSAGSLASAGWLAGRSLTDLFTHPGHPAARDQHLDRTRRAASCHNDDRLASDNPQTTRQRHTTSQPNRDQHSPLKSPP